MAGILYCERDARCKRAVHGFASQTQTSTSANQHKKYPLDMAFSRCVFTKKEKPILFDYHNPKKANSQ